MVKMRKSNRKKMHLYGVIHDVVVIIETVRMLWHWQDPCPRSLPAAVQFGCFSFR